MAIPNLLEIRPTDGSIGWPIGEPIVVSFDRSIDPVTLKNYIALYGADFDHTSGPDMTMWIDKDTGDNPFFLKSPGLKGTVDLQMRLVYYDLDTGTDVGVFQFTDESDEIDYGVAGVGHRAYLTPVNGQLAPDTEYILQVLGDPDTQDVGISARTVYDVEPAVGNVSTSGIVVSSGSYTGTTEETVRIEITSSGDIGEARYEWRYESAAPSEAKRNKLTNRRYRLLDSGLQIRFDGEQFSAGDVFRFKVYPAQRLPTNTKITFTTNDGSYTQAPDSPAVGGSSDPPQSVLPPAPGMPTADSYLQVLEMIPSDGAYNVSLKTNEIVILFSENLEPSSVTDDTVRIWKYPALGWWQGQADPVELAKRITVSGQTIQIQI